MERKDIIKNLKVWMVAFIIFIISTFLADKFVPYPTSVDIVNILFLLTFISLVGDSIFIALFLLSYVTFIKEREIGIQRWTVALVISLWGFFVLRFIFESTIAVGICLNCPLYSPSIIETIGSYAISGFFLLSVLSFVNILILAVLCLIKPKKNNS